MSELTLTLERDQLRAILKQLIKEAQRQDAGLLLEVVNEVKAELRDATVNNALHEIFDEYDDVLRALA